MNKPSDLNNKKRINYRGVLRFDIPKEWIEEYDDKDGATFYEDDPLSGTLRVKLISISVPENLDSVNTSGILDNLIPNKVSKTIELPNGNAYNMFYEHGVEIEIDITIFYWLLVQKVERNKTRLANFSYTVISEKLNNKHIQKEIEFITSQVETATFKAL